MKTTFTFVAAVIILFSITWMNTKAWTSKNLKERKDELTVYLQKHLPGVDVKTAAVKSVEQYASAN